jgi:hypothetical protein
VSASDHLGPQFYHGSPNQISGEVNPLRPDPINGRTYAYFTTNPKEAEGYALGRSSGQKVDKGYVYQVEPTGSFQHDADSNGYRSELPLKVTDVRYHNR